MSSRLPFPIQRVAVTGGRIYDRKNVVWKALDKVLEENPEVILVVGDAKGADELAREWAEDRGLITKQRLVVFYADWKTHGRAAGPIRNGEMVKFGFDLLLAFDGNIGTENMIKQTTAQNIPIRYPDYQH